MISVQKNLAGRLWAPGWAVLNSIILPLMVLPVIFLSRVFLPVLLLGTNSLAACATIHVRHRWLFGGRGLDMPITITLDDELAGRLKREAETRQVSLQQWAVELLNGTHGVLDQSAAWRELNERCSVLN
jgi:hypothetical protein